MKNTITVTIPFSFKGVEHSPSSIIDLDEFITGDQTLDNAYQRVANENKVDNFSYEYEVLQSSEMKFSNPTGIAGDYLKGNTFDLEGFKQRRSHANVDKILQDIANKVLNIDNFESDHESNKKIKQALQEAYQAGLKQCR